jgi:hypothetical protein
MYIVYLPSFIYYMYLSIKARSFYFFSATNPSIETGGMFFESKSKIFDLIPSKFYPKTILISENEDVFTIKKKFDASGLIFPVIAKPDRGERGWKVCILNHFEEIANYRLTTPVDFLLQAYIDFPIELSIFYYRNPNRKQGKITSVTFKEYLNVKGDGKNNLKKLIANKPRAFLQMDKLAKDVTLNFDEVLPNGEKKVLVPYGNHVRGAMFLDYGHIIDDKLNGFFDEMSCQINGFYFGRYDLKCESIKKLREGKNFAIVELNGAGAEPAHIYQPGFSFWKAQKVILKHLYWMYEAASINHAKGIEYLSHNQFKLLKQAEKAYKAKVK